MTSGPTYTDKLQRLANEKEIRRFWSKVKTPTSTAECWQWLGTSNAWGYGYFWFNNKMVRAHRFAYSLVCGTIPTKATLDHLCRNRICVNPYHLEATSQKENVYRGAGLCAQNARKTQCKNGHPLVEGNLVGYLSKKGVRYCHICYRAEKRAYWHRRAKA